MDIRECILRVTFFFALLLLISGCETTKLWSGNPADEYIKVVPQSPDEDVELALKQSGRKYSCQDLYASSYPNNKVCYAAWTADDRVKNIKVKLLKTPETLALDAGRTILVVGYVTLETLARMNFHSG